MKSRPHRTKQVAIRFTPSEVAALRKAVGNRPLSEWIRWVVLDVLVWRKTVSGKLLARFLAVDVGGPSLSELHRVASVAID